MKFKSIQILPQPAKNISANITKDSKLHLFWDGFHVTCLAQTIMDDIDVYDETQL